MDKNKQVQKSLLKVLRVDDNETLALAVRTWWRYESCVFG